MSITKTFIVLVVALMGTSYLDGQIVSITGQTCVSSTLDVPLGQYYGGLAECVVKAVCGPQLVFNSTMFAQAYSGLACPTHTVENNANGGWNFVDTINAHAVAIDIVSFGIRGQSYAGETCGVLFPVYFSSEDRSVCDNVLMDPPTGGDPGPPAPILCFYGSTDSCGCGDDDPYLDLTSGGCDNEGW